MIRTALLTVRVFALLTVALPSVARAWVTNGVPVCSADGIQRSPVAASDGANGVIVAWVDERADAPGIYAQRVAYDGTMIWAANGVLLSGATPVHPPRIVADGAGGAIVVWPTGSAIQAQRIDAYGTLHAGWPADGKVLTTDVSATTDFDAITDGAGGAYIARWRSVAACCGNPASQSVVVSRIDSDGNTVAGWPAAGIILRSSNDTHLLAFAPDPTGGLLCGVNWWVDVATNPHRGLFQRWKADATQPYAFEPYNAHAVAPSDGIFDAACASDGAGGSYWTWRAVNGASASTFGQHVHASGLPLWADPYPVPFSELVVQNGSNGVWYVGRPLGTNQLEVHLRSVDGSIPDPWTDAGFVLSSPPALGAVAAVSRSGAVLVCWSEKINTSFDIRALVLREDQLLPSGQNSGILCNAGDDQNSPVLAVTGTSVIACWEDQRSGAASQDIYAMLVPSSPLLSFEVSLVDASLLVSNQDPAARLTWFSVSPGLRATVERTGPNSDWEPVGPVRQNPGSGYLSYFDYDLVPGVRYGYRLAWTEADGEHQGGEAWLDVPAARLGVVGFADPMLASWRGRPSVVFDLENDAPATLDVFDVTGRLIWTNPVINHTPGRHRVPLYSDRPLDPGVYVIRLRQGDHAATKKGVLVSYTR